MMGAGIVTLAGGLLMAIIGGTVAGQATVAGMASSSDFTIPVDGTDVASASSAQAPVSHVGDRVDCSDCSDRTGYATISLPIGGDLPEAHLYVQ